MPDGFTLQNQKGIMKKRFLLFRRGEMFYCEDTTTRRQTSLRTADRGTAETLLHAKEEAVRQPAMNLQMAQVYLQHSDSALGKRTWQHVMEQIVSLKRGPTGERWQCAIRDRAFNGLRNRKLVETVAEDFLSVLKIGTVTTNVYLRRIHNFAVGMHWLPWPILPKMLWPALQHREKRAITWEEHQKIVQRERNLATHAYYELLWHLGGSQTDVAVLTAEDVDWKQRTIAYRRRKSGTTALISFGESVAAILKTLPETGFLFPALARLHERHRSKLFIKRLRNREATPTSFSLVPRVHWLVNSNSTRRHPYREFRKCFSRSGTPFIGFQTSLCNLSAK